MFEQQQQQQVFRGSQPQPQPYGGVNNIYAAGAKVADNYINNQFDLLKDILFKRQKKEQDRKDAEAKFRLNLAQLDNQQKFLLAQRLQDAQNETEKLKILSEFASVTGQSKSKNALTTALIFMGGALLLFGVVYFIKKRNIQAI
jgi:hypothetical protein